MQANGSYIKLGTAVLCHSMHIAYLKLLSLLLSVLLFVLSSPSTLVRCLLQGYQPNMFGREVELTI